MSEQQFNQIESMCVRNLSIIAHVDHGKTSVCDSLLSAGGQINSSAVGKCVLDNALAESAARGITIVASSVSLLFDVARPVLDEGRRAALARMSALQLPPLANNINTNTNNNNNKVDDDNADDDDDDGSDDNKSVFYVEAVPFEWDVTRLRSALASALGDETMASACQVSLRHNHSARLVLPSGIAAPSEIVVGDNLSALRVTRAVGSLLGKARALAAARNVAVPSFDVARVEAEFVCNGSRGSTRREARHAAAAAFVTSLSTVSPTTPTMASVLPPLSNGANALTVNLIDSPGHVDFSAEVSSALRLTDGAVVVVDSVEGIAPQTISVLRQALRERVRVVLFVNKVDRAIGELQLDAASLAQKLSVVVDGVNTALGGVQASLSFAAGTVAFGSALEGWGVSLDAFCELLASRGDVDVSGVRSKLAAGADESVAFRSLVLQPIFIVRTAVANGDFDAALRCLTRVGRAPTGKTLESWKAFVAANDRKQLMRQAMKLMYPLAGTLVGMMTRYLPSPLEAQRVRADVLYSVPQEGDAVKNDDPNDDDDDDKDKACIERDVERDDDAKRAIRLCDPNGVTMLFASKQIAINGRMHSIARIFSGTVRVGDELIVHDSDGTTRRARVGGLVVPTARDSVRIDEAHAGMIVAIANLALTGGTATSSVRAAPFLTVKALVTDVVGLVLKIGNGAKGDARKKLIDAARALAASDVALRVVQSADGTLTIRGVGELHLEIALSRLRSASGVPIDASQPIVTLRETTVRASERAYLGKSSNKHNRVYFMCEPLTPELTADLEAASSDAERRAALSKNRYSVADAKRVLSFGGVSALLVDRTQGVSVAPIADSLVQAFRQIADAGVLAPAQPMAGVAFVLVDCRYHADNKHRAPGDIVPAAVRSMTAAALGSALRLLEPLLKVDINCSVDVSNIVYSTLHRRGATCGAATTAASTSGGSAEQRFVSISATLSVRQSIGLVGDLRQATKGQAFATMESAGWRLVNGDALSDGESEAAQIVGDARERASMSRALPTAADFEDRL